MQTELKGMKLTVKEMTDKVNEIDKNVRYFTGVVFGIGQDIQYVCVYYVLLVYWCMA